MANFLNTKNHADKRVLELLQEKLNLFDGLFGSSDEILGALESGLDFEKKQWQKPAAQIFQEKTEAERARIKEEEKMRKANIEEDKWQEVKLPEGTERNPE